MQRSCVLVDMGLIGFLVYSETSGGEFVRFLLFFTRLDVTDARLMTMGQSIECLGFATVVEPVLLASRGALL